MDGVDVIIDISSDEENMVDESVDISEEWLNELLESVDREALRDLDDVVVADELPTPSFMKKPSSLQKESDDDCLILDCDPDIVVSVVDGEGESVAGCADLLIVGEKGHCHCYVCDSRAPCIYWGFGLSTADHCHASEKEQVWISLRNYFKHPPNKFSEPLWLPPISQSNTQPFRNLQNIYHPSSGFYSLEQPNSSQLHRTSVQSFLSSEVLQRSIQPEVPNNMEIIRCMLASFEEHLMGNDYNGGSMEDSNIPSASSLNPALSKPLLRRSELVRSP